MKNETPLFERREFIAFAQWEGRGEVKRRFWLLFGLFAMGTLGLACFIGRSKEESPEWWLGVMAMAVLFMVFLTVLKRLSASPFQRCPHCKTSAERGNRYIMIATGRCGGCGESVFRDAKEVQEHENQEGEGEGALFSDLAEFFKTWRGHQSIWKRVALVLLGLFWLAQFIGLARLARALPELTLSPLMKLGVAFGGLAFFFFSLPLLHILLDRLITHSIFRCPGCHESLLRMNRGIVIASGRCGCCGQAIFRQRGKLLLTGGSSPDKLDRHDFVARVPWLQKIEGNVSWRQATWSFVLVVALLVFHAAGLENIGLSIVAAVFVALGAVGLRGMWQRRHLTRCPCCKRSTQHSLARPVIIATGRCGYCGEAILADGPVSR